jgi:hypothetical protein
VETFCLRPSTKKEGTQTDDKGLHFFLRQNFNVKGEVQVFLIKGLSRKSQTLLGSVTNTQDGPKQVSRINSELRPKASHDSLSVGGIEWETVT